MEMLSDFINFSKTEDTGGRQTFAILSTVKIKKEKTMSGIFKDVRGCRMARDF